MTEHRKMSIVDILNKVDDGGALEDLKDALAEVTKALYSSGIKSKGTVTLTLEITRVGANQIIVVDKVKATKPSIKKDGSIFFADRDGGISRDNPDQGLLHGRSEVGK